MLVAGACFVFLPERLLGLAADGRLSELRPAVYWVRESSI